MTTKYEQYLIDTILPKLEQGRLNWDRPHTELVVGYIKSITAYSHISGRERDLLIIAAYLHDYGYLYFVDELAVGPTSGRPKKEHAKKSEEKWQEIMINPVFDFLDQQEKDRISHLILVHDEVNQLVSKDELILMEADTLGAFAMGNRHNIEPKKYQNYLEQSRHYRVDRFITPYSIEEADRLLSAHHIDDLV